jgi:hypothetical protein
MMRKHNPQIQEDGFHWLLHRAEQHVEELIEDFTREEEHGLKCWLLELIGEARSPKAFTLLCEQLRSPDESLRDWAILGLQQLGNKEARRALFDARVGQTNRPTRR